MQSSRAESGDATTDRDIRPAVRNATIAAEYPAADGRTHRPAGVGDRAGAAQPSSILVPQRLGLVATGLAAPLYHRFRLGEGGLLAVNAALALKYFPLGEGLGLAAISLLCLLSLYLFNDIVDARDDQHNPKKDRLLAALYVRERGLFLALWLLTSGIAVGAGAWLDGRVGLWVFAVSLINVAYSMLLKKVPFADIAWVGVWGGAYALIVTDAPAWILMVAAMTSICHIYQISEDRGADAASGIATSATLRAPLLSLLHAGLAAIVVASAWTLSGSVAALTLVGLLAYWLRWRDRPRIAWILAKVHFSLVLAYLLAGG